MSIPFDSIKKNVFNSHSQLFVYHTFEDDTYMIPPTGSPWAKLLLLRSLVFLSFDVLTIVSSFIHPIKFTILCDSKQSCSA